MELREWQYINKPAANTASASSASSNTGNKSFKKRFDKIIKYYGDHLPAEVDYIIVNLLTKDTLDFTENYNDGDKVRYNIFIDPATEAWKIKYSVNGQLTDDLSGTGWPELLKILRTGYIEVPATTTLEYKNLLTEWVAMNNKTSSTGYKKRFEKLIKYHIDHASSELESITHKDIKEDSFRLSEHYDNGHHEFDRDIIASYDKASDTFMLRIFIDGKEVDNILRKGYEDFVDAAEDYMFLPGYGTQEYDELLTESLNEWQLMNPPKAAQPASTTSSKTNEEKFSELVAYMQKHRDSSTIFTSVNGPNDTGFEYEEQRAPAGVKEYNLSVEVSLGKHDLFTIHVDKDGKRIESIMAKGWEDFLRYLKVYFNAPPLGSPEYKSLTESLNEWHLMNPPASSSAPSSTGSFESYKNRFNKLFDYATKHKHSSVDQTAIEELSEDEHTSMFHFTHHVLGGAQGFDYDLEIILAINKPQGNWYLLVYEFDDKTHDKIADLQGPDYETLLKTLSDYIEVPAVGSAEYKDLLQESINTSIADDFKLYENLWENI